MAKEITKKSVLKYFEEELRINKSYYDDCGEINSTLLAENAQDYFKCMTDLGDSEIETNIFDWATEYVMPKPAFIKEIEKGKFYDNY